MSKKVQNLKCPPLRFDKNIPGECVCLCMHSWLWNGTRVLLGRLCVIRPMDLNELCLLLGKTLSMNQSKYLKKIIVGVKICLFFRKLSIITE